MKNQIVAIVERLRRVTKIESMLVQRLGDELTRSDDKLLAGVQTVTAMHERKREEILGELRHLAGRIGALPDPDDDVMTVDYEEIELPDYLMSSEDETYARSNADGSQPAGTLTETLAEKLKSLAPFDSSAEKYDEPPWPEDDPHDSALGADWRQATAAIREKYESPSHDPASVGDEMEPVHH